MDVEGNKSILDSLNLSFVYDDLHKTNNHSTSIKVNAPVYVGSEITPKESLSSPAHILHKLWVSEAGCMKYLNFLLKLLLGIAEDVVAPKETHEGRLGYQYFCSSNLTWVLGGGFNQNMCFSQVCYVRVFRSLTTWRWSLAACETGWLTSWTTTKTWQHQP